MKISNDELLEIVAKAKNIPVERLFTTYDHDENVFYIEVEEE